MSCRSGSIALTRRRSSSGGSAQNRRVPGAGRNRAGDARLDQEWPDPHRVRWSRSAPPLALEHRSGQVMAHVVPALPEARHRGTPAQMVITRHSGSAGRTQRHRSSRTNLQVKVRREVPPDAREWHAHAPNGHSPRPSWRALSCGCNGRASHHCSFDLPWPDREPRAEAGAPPSLPHARAIRRDYPLGVAAHGYRPGRDAWHRHRHLLPRGPALACPLEAASYPFRNQRPSSVLAEMSASATAENVK